MTYMELMNRFWMIDIEASFSCTESKLYFALLDIVNRLLTKVNCSKKSLFTAGKKLEAYGLIHVTKGERSTRAAVYKITDATKAETHKYTIEKKKDTTHVNREGMVEETKTEPVLASLTTPYIRKEQEEEKEQENKKTR